jgi:Uma2 family endonuclease
MRTDFVMELRSKSDTLPVLQQKRKEYAQDGSCLGWWINRQQQQVETHCSSYRTEMLDFLQTLSGVDC